MESIVDAKNLIGACSLYTYLFRDRPYRLEKYLSFEKTAEGTNVSINDSRRPEKRILAYEMLSSMLMTYSNAIRLVGVNIKTRVCEKAMGIFKSEVHKEKIIFPRPVDIRSLHPDKYLLLDIPYPKAAKLLLAQQYMEPLVNPDYFTLKINPENIDSFIIVDAD